MPDRLSALDASFLFAEHRTAAMHVGAVMTFAPPPDRPFDPDAFTALIGDRLSLVPGYRRKLREVPAGLGLPVWVDDPSFDLDYHVRRSALPAPGTPDQLRELVGRLLARRLDRSRPLWEVYLVEGMADGGFAVVTKTHHAMVDGLASMDIGAALLDPTPQPRRTEPDDWCPAPEPSGLELAASAAGEALLRPGLVLDRAQRAAVDVRETVDRVSRAMQGVVSAGRSAVSTRPVPALTAATGEQRRYGMARTPLVEHRAVRRGHGGTVNDVMLAVVAGGLRSWLTGRGEPPPPEAVVRALVPVSVRARARGERASAGNSISACLVDLPVGEPDPVSRLAAVRRQMQEQKRGGHAVGASALVGLVGLAPPLVHSLGARLASQYSSRFYNVLVTNVPGPPRPLYALGARMRDMYPVVPLAGGQAVAIGITTYDGGVHYGLTADRDAAPDVDDLAAALAGALEELVAAG
ncbi:WS/DGAT/MGAT family O-acyltransferase [Pseudonocardia humida]|uniref:Diacylglycerol O-acyltransferase n=1 Tax=Pseudonocardia humida TaxID=2800819 RepID=A0ABT1AD04_9PSEU|nr:wax ester/triacylglycerol synthase family O-acyltransferase [Pseudonocardia humida]MCO1660930.1 wax ester/triacylglycerol synthase family O-acyltransferase [Pseudonocardia humida]